MIILTTVLFLLTLGLRLTMKGTELLSRGGSLFLRGEDPGSKKQKNNKVQKVASKGLKFAVKSINTICGISLPVMCALLVIFFIVLLVVVASAAGFITVLMGDINYTNIPGMSSGDSNGSGAAGIFSTDCPPGIDPESWNKADDRGKSVAGYAYYVINKDYNEAKHIKYGGGNTDDSYKGQPYSCDCTDFVNWCLNGGAGITFTGQIASADHEPRGVTKGEYLNPWNDVGWCTSEYYSTGSGHWTSSAPGYVFSFTIPASDSDFEKMAPGDIVVCPGHAQMFFGKNTNGEWVIAECSGSSEFHIDPLFETVTPTTGDGGGIGLTRGANLKPGEYFKGKVAVVVRPGLIS